MDILYTVREGDNNEELRYSLRSLKNIPHNRVFIVGYKPSWVKNVIHIPTEQDDLKYSVTTNNIMDACSFSDLSDDFILMNDDFFIMKPMDKINPYHRGEIDDVVELYKKRYDDVSLYVQGMIDTKEYMRELGISSSLSYELHIPMVMNRDKFVDMINRFEADLPDVAVLHKRTLYGNMYNVGGEQRGDVKIYDHNESGWSFLRGDFEKLEDLDFISTDDSVFVPESKVYKFITSHFKEKSKYERHTTTNK